MIPRYIGSAKMKYEELNNFVYNKFPKGNKVNIYIDINSLVSPLYTINIMNAYESNANKYAKSIVTSLFELVAHYRHYFFSRYEVPTKIYFYYSFKRPKELTKLYDMYEITKFNKLISPTHIPIHNFIKKEISFFKTIIDYFQEIYCIDTGDLDREVFPYMMIKDFTGDNDVNLVLSKTVKSQQLLNLDRTILMDISKKKTLLAKEDLIPFITTGIKTNVEDFDMDLSQLPLLYSLTGVKSYDILGISGCGIVGAMKLIKREFSDRQFILSKELLKHIIDDPLTVNKIYLNARLLSLDYEYNMLTKSYKIEMLNQIKDNVDIEVITELNREVFGEALQLRELSSGCMKILEKRKFF